MDENQTNGELLSGELPANEPVDAAEAAVTEAPAAQEPPQDEPLPSPEATEPPVEVIGIRFKKSGKIYYFNPDGKTFTSGMNAIVETARGVEYGGVALGNRMVPASETVPPLRKVIRAATPEDDKKHEENVAREKEAFEVCVRKINEHKLDMKLIDVEYTFDNNKLLFYFTADGRIDFRDLVKDLASVFRTRIELRQIGIRDEAKMLGGLGICGRPFCCSSFLGDFVQVSIKMAKDQNLSLNSAKISGSCGRLMCCLRYEYDTYEEGLHHLPKLESIVTTPDGDGTVVETRPLSGQVRVRLFNESDQPPKTYDRTSVYLKGTTRPDTFPSGEEAAAAKAGEPGGGGDRTERPNQDRRPRYDRRRPPAKLPDKKDEPETSDSEQSENRRRTRPDQVRREQNPRQNQSRPASGRQGAQPDGGAQKAADPARPQGERAPSRPQNQRRQNDRPKAPGQQNHEAGRQPGAPATEKSDAAGEEKRANPRRNRRGNRPQKPKAQGEGGSGGEKVNNS